MRAAYPALPPENERSPSPASEVSRASKTTALDSPVEPRPLMTPVNPFFAAFVVVIALLVATALSKTIKFAPADHRNEALDGLRGYLAVFVFIHHASIWYYFVRTDEWRAPPSNLYTLLGQASVAMFFMITGYLFFAKLLRADRKPIDWVQLYVSRVLRIVPLYLFAISLMLVFVFIVSDFQVRESPLVLLTEVVRWLSFDFLGKPDINGVPVTYSMTAGVTWSLAYEWFFYFSLPLVAFFLQRRTPAPWLIGSALLVALLVFGPFWNAELRFAGYFLGGMLAALVSHRTAFPKLAVTKSFSLIALTCVVLTVSFFPSAYGLVPCLLLCAAFIIVSSGNTLFGLLTLKPAKLLGEISYSIYLLHGLLLYLVFELLLGSERVQGLSVAEFWLLAGVCVPVLITFCLASFRVIEAPAMTKVSQLTLWLRERSGARRPARTESKPGPVPAAQDRLADESTGLRRRVT